MMARLYVLTVFAYPLVLVLLCVGAGLLVDRLSGRFLPAAVLPAVGAAALVGVSQLTTYLSAIASATPYVLLAVSLAGYALARARARAMIARARSHAPALAGGGLVYAFALAPVLLAGRPSFSSFMALSDSAVHLIGADFLIHHGQDYRHLDLHNSYGQFIHDYYGTSYPSGADTLFGGSALLLRLPLIWTFQPFNGAMLALAYGPAWALARHIGLRGAWAAGAALAASVPALVYGYELIGSVKEVSSLAMILTLGVLVTLHRSWLARGPGRAVPFALVLGAGVSTLGLGFGAWGLAAAVALLVALLADLLAGRATVAGGLLTVAAGAIVLFLAALPTWLDASRSLQVAQNIASTGNPGNLHTPLKWTQVLGVWLRDSYKEAPTGGALTTTHVLIVVTLVACGLGVLWLMRTRRYALAGWIALMLLAWAVLSRYSTTWVSAKSLMMTSPVVVLLAWAGVAALRSPRSRTTALAAVLALALLGGAIASDAAQYHSSSLAPTARYDELGELDERFAGRGPVLFTDFDEYSMYVLRHLDVGGPDFVYPPPALASLAGGYGQPVVLDRASPRALEEYPLIITRRDPSAAPPPADYALLWHGRYYNALGRRDGVAPAAVHVADAPSDSHACAGLSSAARTAPSRRLTILAALAPALVRVPLESAAHPHGWEREREGFAMRGPGTLSARFTIPRGGVWEVWLQGQFMPSVQVGVDGRQLATISGQLAGNSLVPDTVAPARVQLAVGEHIISITRGGFSLAPGNGATAVLAGAFLTPSGTPARRLRTLSPTTPPSELCSSAYAWIELVGT